MSETLTGTLEYRNLFTSKGGTNPGSLNARPKIDGVQYFAPQWVADTVGRLQEGSQVSFIVNPPREPDGNPMIVKIWPAGEPEPSHGGGRRTEAPRQYTKPDPAGTTKFQRSGEDATERRVSMFIAYAKDLVVAKVIDPKVMTVQGVGNAIQTMAGELLRSFHRLLADEREAPPSSPSSGGGESAAKSGPAAQKAPPATPPSPPAGGEDELRNMETYIDGVLKDQGFPQGIQMDSVKKSRQNFLAQINDPKMWAEKYVEDLIKYVAGTAKKKIVNGGLEFVS